MSGIDGGNPNPSVGGGGDEYETHTCDRCGATYKILANHLPECDNPP